MKMAVAKLYDSTQLDPRDEAEERMALSFTTLLERTAHLPEREAYDVIVAMAQPDQAQHDNVCLGLLFGILTNPAAAPKCFRDLTMVQRDSWKAVVNMLNLIIYEKYSKLSEIARHQVLWLLRSCIRSGVEGVVVVLQYLLRQIPSGDFSPKSLWLADNLADILLENKVWLAQQNQSSLIIPAVVYAYLRLVADLVGPQFATLRVKEVKLCEAFLRERFADCMLIGRDLARLLMQVARIPEFELFWQDLLHNPSNLSPQLKSFFQLLQMRPRKQLLISRLTPDMEKKIFFVLTETKQHASKKYLDWFQKQYLSTPESQLVRGDLIRHICAVIHPSNQIIASDCTQRWFVVLWLLNTCTSVVAGNFARLALFYDWMFYEADKSDIMNIEPGILVLANSRQPNVLANLFDYLARLTAEFTPKQVDQKKVRDSIALCFAHAVEKRVIPSWTPILEKLDNDVRSLLRTRFPELNISSAPEVPLVTPSEYPTLPPTVVDIDEAMKAEDDADSGAHFSEEEDEEKRRRSKSPQDSPSLRVKDSLSVAAAAAAAAAQLKMISETDFTTAREQLPAETQRVMKEMITCDEEAKGELVQQLMVHICSEELDIDDDEDFFVNVAICLCFIFSAHFEEKLFPCVNSSEENLQQSVAKPFFVILRNFCLNQDDAKLRDILRELVAAMYSKQPRIGYNLIYFLKAEKLMEKMDKLSIYVDVCNASGQDVDECLPRDMILLEDFDHRMFCFLLPDVYTKLSSVAIPSKMLMRLIVGCIDAIELQELISNVVQHRLTMFKRDCFADFMSDSLRWETLEQYFLWQLIAAHDVVKLDWFNSLLSRLQFAEHAEAMTSLTIMIKCKKCPPSTPLVRAIFLRNPHRLGDSFGASLLQVYILYEEDEDKLAELVARFVVTAAQACRQAGVKPKKQEVKNPTMELMLAHLDSFLKMGKDGQAFLMKDSIQSALHDAHKACTEQLRRRYDDLFEAVEALEQIERTGGRTSLRRRRVVPARSAAMTAATAIAVDSSDEEDEGKPKPPKRKRLQQTHNDELYTTSD